MNSPLVVVCGCTGSGKSELGLSIAEEFNGEVVSADSMQIYKGLDIATNKLNSDEMAGIPHHLIGSIEPTYSGYGIHKFRKDALEAIQMILDRGKLPILVGGTAYYVESVIYYNNLVETERNMTDRIRCELLFKFPTPELRYRELERVDPESAAELLRNTNYKVLRALEIYYSTGKTKSEILKEQLEGTGNNTHFGNRLRFQSTFMINLDADKNLLIERLDKRVDQMMERGLLDELSQFYDKYKDHLLVGPFGVMQCIGLKEFMPYLQLDETEREDVKAEKLLKECKERLKIQNRQYAQYQRKWFYNRIIKRGQHREVPKSIAMNTANDFHQEIVPFVLNLVRLFLAGKDIDTILDSNSPLKMELPPTNDVLSREEFIRVSKKVRHCEVCNTDVQGILHWEAHLRGRRHRKNLAAEKEKKGTQIKKEPPLLLCDL